jgi:hypothetical protein
MTDNQNFTSPVTDATFLYGIGIAALGTVGVRI